MSMGVELLQPCPHCKVEMLYDSHTKAWYCQNRVCAVYELLRKAGSPSAPDTTDRQDASSLERRIARTLRVNGVGATPKLINDLVKETTK
jgi:hypothetical protein